MSQRTRTSMASALVVVFALVVGLVVVKALQADGRERSRTETNDGGAWLVRRRDGDAAHINYAIREQTARLHAASTPAGSRADFDIEQAPGMVVAYDRVVGVINLIDPISQSKLGEVAVGKEARVFAVPDGVLVADQSSLSVWALDRQDILDADRLEDIEPDLQGGGPTMAAVRPDGEAAFYDGREKRVVFRHRGGSTSRSPVIGDPDEIVDMSLIGDTAVLVDATNDLYFVTDDDVSSLDATNLVADSEGGAGATKTTLTIQQSSNTGDTAVVMTPQGGAIVVPFSERERGEGNAVEQFATVGGVDPVPPIVYGGCLFAVTTSPVTYLQQCGDEEVERKVLDTMGPHIRLLLVNGWIWINDLDSGTVHMAEPHQTSEEVQDLGDIEEEASNEPTDDTTAETSPEQEDIENPDDPQAQEMEADETDDDGENDPPVARDDTVGTRADRPVVVNVLLNDNDSDGDVLVIESFDNSQVPEGARVETSAARDSLMITPPPGFTGEITVPYVVSDGHGLSDGANVLLTVKPNGSEGNEPPDTTIDTMTTRPNRPASVNVLANDIDPDGDLLTLTSVAPKESDGPTGTISFEPSGQVEFNPDIAADGPEILELVYVVTDEFGAPSEGTLRVRIRREDTNNEPDARKDSIVGVAGRGAFGRVLTNDRDPDDDPLFVSGEPRLISALDASGAATNYTLAELNVRLTPDGEFFFTPPVAGSYVFSYEASDGAETNQALIRVEAVAAAENRPPSAIRDVVTIAPGGTATMFPLQNDTDPDGDVVSLVSTGDSEDLDLQIVEGVGLTIRVGADAPPVVPLSYSITDGLSEPVTGTILVNVADGAAQNQPPVVRPDVIEARPGTTVSMFAVANDFDPEGKPVTIAAVTSGSAATATISPTGQQVEIAVPTTQTSSFDVAYDAVDGDGNTASSVIRVRVVPTDQPNRVPIPRLDTLRARAGIESTVAVLDNDNDPDGDKLYIESIDTQPRQGTAYVGADGTIVYTPLEAARGSDSFSYVVVDGRGGRSVGNVQIGVVPADAANRDPDALADDFDVVLGSTARTLDSSSNDTDPDGDTLQVTKVTSASLGEATVVDGAIVYTPPESAPNATDVLIRYTVDDGRGGTDEAEISIRLIEATEAIEPVAVGDNAGPVGAGQPVTVDVVRNDLDADGNIGDLVVTSDDPAVTVNEDRTITITSGPESGTFAYTITDPDGLSDTGTVAVLVVDNVPPTVAEPIELSTTYQTPSEPVNLGALVTDADQDPLTFVIGESEIGGQAAATSTDGFVVTFSPNSDFSGQTTFSFIADDGAGHRVAVPVVVNVEPPANVPPTAQAGTFDVEPDGTPLAVELPKLVTDADEGETFTFAMTQTSGSATLALEGPNVTAVADPSIAGTTSTADFTVTDSQGNQATATLTFNVAAIDADPPTLANDTVSVNAGAAASVNVLANDIDPYGKGLTVMSVSSAGAPAADGVGAAIGTGGNIEITAGPQANGQYPISYTVSDPLGRTANATIDVAVAGLPGGPTNVSAAATSHQVVLTWSAPPANGAPIERFEIAPVSGNNAPGAPVATSTGTSVTIGDLENGVSVKFVVRAVNSVGAGPWSPASNEVIPDIEPGIPSAPTVVAGDRSLTISWTQPPNDGSAITNYNLRSSSGETRPVGAGTSYTWTGLTNGENYTFQVQAENGAGPGEFSAPSQAEHPYTTPGAPSNVSGERQNGAVALSWTAAENGGDTISGYEIQRDTDGSTNSSVGTSVTWSNLQNGVTYRFRVRAQNRAGYGPWSEYSSGITPCGTPLAPGRPTATRGDLQATITWPAADGQGCPITQYTIRTNDGKTMTTGGSATSAVFTGLTNGTSYTFTVVATNDEGQGVASPPSNNVIPAGPPTTPTLNKADPGVNKVDLAWSASNPNGGLNLRYELRTNGATTDVGNVTSMTKTGLTPGTDYKFEVRACNDVDCSPWSNSKSARTPDKPGTPSLSLTAGDGTIKATWTTPGANGSPITHYVVTREPGGVSRQESGNSTDFPNASNGTTYTITVKACNAVGCGSADSGTATPKAPDPVVRASVGAYHTVPGCTSQYCRDINLSASNLVPGRTYTVECRSDRAGAGLWNSHTVTASGSGTASWTGRCVWGYPDNDVWLSINGVNSNHVRVA